MNDVKSYTISEGPRGHPVIGSLLPAALRPLEFFSDNRKYGDIIPFRIMGNPMVQLNHPDFIRHVLIDNHKNYNKGVTYIRFESAIGQGLLTSNGEKWQRDRKKIQPMFKREQLEGYYFDIINEVTERCKTRWMELTGKGPAKLNLTEEMSKVTTEIILRVIFGKDNLTDEMIISIHRSFYTIMDYLKTIRTHPKVDLCRLFRLPEYNRFKKELDSVDKVVAGLLQQYKNDTNADKYNMLALLFAAQKADPENFSELDLRDHCVTMVFAGFETTSILMQWMWYALSTRPEIVAKARIELGAMINGGRISIDDLSKLNYLAATYKETMRFYPPLWVTVRAAIEDDEIGGYKITKGTECILPQILLHHDARFWENPEIFMPERFLPENESRIDMGQYFPFSQGPRKCSGYHFVDIEVKVLFAKLLPHFDVKIINAEGNGMAPSVSLKTRHPLQAEIRRL